MKIISIETSTEACSAALLIDDEVIERFEIAASKHSQLILPMIESLLNEADVTLSQLEVIAFSCGPGSFTGLRIAAGVVQGIALAADLPVAPVSTLAVLAQHAYELNNKNYVLAALDARMNEVYWGGFHFDSKGLCNNIEPERVCLPSKVNYPQTNLTTESWFGVGPGWTRYAAELECSMLTIASTDMRKNVEKIEYELNVLPAARYVASLARHAFLQGQVVAAEQALPVYLRDNIAKKKAKT